MTREAINLTISEPLRRAQIPQRLDALAQITGLAQAQLAGRALTIGLGYIEADLTLIFPGVAAPSSDNASPPALVATPAPAAGRDDAQHGAASPLMVATPAVASTPAPEPAPPPRTEQPEPEPRADRLGTQDAARALGYGSKDAFTQHVHRHSELKRCGRKSGNVWTWDMSKLRAEYERRGWAPK